MLLYQRFLENSDFASMLSLLTNAFHCFLGPSDNLLLALILFTLIDFLTSLLCTIPNGKLCTQTIKKLINRTITLFLLVTVSNIIDVYLASVVNTLRKVTLEYYIMYEGIAILENASRLGVPIPKMLKVFLTNLHSQENDTLP